MPTSARARVRDELTLEIKDAARRQLAVHGSAGLSLRAVARELGMASSAVYRYFPSRDELLSALLIDAYNAVGLAAEEADAAVRQTNFAGRWLALARAVRRWALVRPQEYALIFGSPVPGFRAPLDTIEPAARLPLLLLRILTDAAAAGRAPALPAAPLPRQVRADLKALRSSTELTLSEGQLARAVTAWTLLIGSISFELFGHLHGVITDHHVYFDFQMHAIAHDLNLDQPKSDQDRKPTRPASSA